MKVISEFRGEYAFLSNMYTCNITYKGLTFTSSEAAFHSQKCLDRSEDFTKLNPVAAKKLGKKVNLRGDWEDVKYSIMKEIVEQKFLQNNHLKHKLLQTGDAELIEGNTWNDTYWGMCRGKGKNNLGKILMEVREKLKNHRR